VLTREIELADKRSLTFEMGAQWGLTEATPEMAVKAQITFAFGG
jgi:hypothetical protein